MADFTRVLLCALTLGFALTSVACDTSSSEPAGIGDDADVSSAGGDVSGGPDATVSDAAGPEQDAGTTVDDAVTGVDTPAVLDTAVGPDTPAELDVASAADVPAEPEVAVEPDASTTPTPTIWCTPQPVSPTWTGAPDLLGLHAAAVASLCGVLALDVDVEGDSVTDSTLPVPSEACADCSEERAFAATWTGPGVLIGWPEHHRALIESRKLASGEREFLMHLREEGSTKQETRRRRFSPAGELVFEAREWTGVISETTEQTWSGGLLTSATTDSTEVAYAVAMAWTYDAVGRLSGATATWNDTTLVVSWTYDDVGRPVLVERHVNGGLWLRQAWDWSASGDLQARATQINTAYSWGGPRPTDHHPVQLPVLFDGPTWTDSLPVDQAGCRRVPTSVHHGYPEGEAVWELGWPLDERPEGMGFDYAYNGYAYGYGGNAWYGHGGVAGGLLELSLGEVIEIAQDYDSEGRLTKETTLHTLGGSLPVSTARERVYAADGTLTADVRTWDGSSGVFTTSFAFAYDSGQRVLDREYSVGDVVVARHTWTYDAEGRVISHGIAHSPSVTTSAAQEWYEGPPELPDDLPAEPPLHFTHEREYSADGSEVTWKRWDAVSGTSSVTAIHRSVTQPDGGLTLQVETGTNVQHTIFDAQGRRTLHGDDYEGDGILDRAATYTFLEQDAATLLLLRFEHTSQTPAEPALESYATVCQ